MTKYITLFGALALVVAVSGCFPSGDSHLLREPAGFLMGIWHGWIAPISLIFGLFDHSVRIYEVNNTGWWYDFGYYMAVISGFGGITLSRGRKKRQSDL
jgi:hypothetical protein